MGSISPFSAKELIPKEETLAIQLQKSNLYIGIPKEVQDLEKRVCLTPEAVNTLTNNGHQVIVEQGVGLAAGYADQEYSQAGAQVVADTRRVYQAPIIIKIDPPTLQEIELLQEGTLLLSAIQLKTLSLEVIEALQKKKITALAFEYIKEKDGSYPIIQSHSEIAGKASILIASELLGNHQNGKGLLLGNITGVAPIEIVILGAGTVAEHAAKTALALGANIRVFDNSISKLRRLQNSLPHPIFTSTLQDKLLLKALRRCDLAIGAIKGKSRSPIVVNQTMVECMKPGAVIVDVCIDTGGCFETSEVTTHANPTFTKFGVTHYCVPNIASRYAKTASISLSNILIPYLLEIADHGGIDTTIHCQRDIKAGVYLYKGKLTNQQLSDWFQIPYHQIDLFLF